MRADEDTRALSAKDAEATIEFNPAFTYPIFGEQEKIFGYKGLDIQVCCWSLDVADRSSNSLLAR